MAKRIKLRIFPNGSVQAEVQGVKGKACTDFIPVLEALLKAETVDSAYTPEYYEGVSVEIQTGQQQHIQGV
ncbi:MAG TPA: DUF2997 domain-containing protein [Bacillota bacterium]|nr:DUF2997 domain-containing protein [Bacillota bacterium]HOL52248.1 DUF2997 domain-containing protein [Bacillota bacterium]HPQ03025.1 DUF2997 domain-containing protein [Bacillota bacterium]